MYSVFKKELTLYFKTPLGYVFCAVTLAVAGGCFFTVCLVPQNSDVKSFFAAFNAALVFLVPMLTMRSFSEERKRGTDELLLTSPISAAQVMLGKYLSAMSVFALPLLATLAFPAILAHYGSLDALVTVGNYAGLLLLASASIAIGLFISVMTDSQLVAAVITYAVLIAASFAGSAELFGDSELLSAAAGFFSLTGHYVKFSYGVFDPANVVYYVGVTAFFLCMSVTALENRRARTYLNGVIVCLAAVALVLANAAASLVSQKFDVALDMTAERLYELSPTTADVTRSLRGDVNIYVLCGESDFPVMLKELLAGYEKLSGLVKTSYIDPYKNPLFVDHYKRMGHDLAENDLLIEGANRAKHVPYRDMLVYAGAGADEKVTGICAEQRISSALLYVDGTSELTAGFTMGHNERPTKALQKLFADGGFTVKNAAPASDERADITVAASPSRDFGEDEIAALERRMDGGGGVMMFIEPGVSEFKNIGRFLKRHGIELEDNVVFEGRAYVSDNPANVVAMYAPHSVNSYFEGNRYYVVMPVSRGLKLSSAALPLLMSTPDAYAKNGLRYVSAAKADGDRSGQFTLAAVTESAAGEGGRLFVAGSRYMYADDVMNADNYANAAFLSQVMNYMCGEAAGVNIPAKTLARPPLSVSIRTSALIGALTAIAAPLCAACVGFAVFIRRRRR